MTADLAIFPPPAAARRNPAAEARHLHPAALPRWRDLLGVRWQERLERIIELSSFAVRDAAGEPLCYVGIKRDVTEQRRAGGELRQKFDELQSMPSIESSVTVYRSGSTRSALLLSHDVTV